MHGLSRTDLPKLKETFGGRFNAVIVVREPIARLRSFVALYRSIRGPNGWEDGWGDLSYVETLAESENISLRSQESKMFVHGVYMLNAILEERPHGTVYKAEDLTTNPKILAALFNEITGGQVGTTREWLQTCLRMRAVNMHGTREPWALTDWEVDVVRAVVRPESWRIYEELGYIRPPFVG